MDYEEVRDRLARHCRMQLTVTHVLLISPALIIRHESRHGDDRPNNRLTVNGKRPLQLMNSNHSNVRRCNLLMTNMSNVLGVNWRIMMMNVCVSHMATVNRRTYDLTYEEQACMTMAQ